MANLYVTLWVGCLAGWGEDIPFLLGQKQVKEEEEGRKDGWMNIQQSSAYIVVYSWTYNR